MKNKKHYLIGLALILILSICLMSGCGEKSNKLKNGEIYLYYTNKDTSKLNEIRYKVKSKDALKQVKEVVKAMNTTSNKVDVITAIPESVEINDITLTDDVVNVDFDGAYLDLKPVEEVICRAAVVLTLTQLDSVDYVSFTVGGDQLNDSFNEPVGLMQATDFVDTKNSNINSYQKISCQLYFASHDGKKLVPVTYDGVYEENKSMEEIIISKLIEGPSDDNYLRTIPSGVKLLGVSTKDGICNVNFDESFLSEKSDVSAKLELYSIVNSLVELNYINKVQITVNGANDKLFQDEISLKYSFSRNLDLVSK